MRLSPLHRSSEVQLIRIQHEAVFRDRVASQPVRPPHVEHDFFINKQLVMQPKVVAVRVQQLLIERLDNDVLVELLLDLVSGEDHGQPFRSEQVSRFGTGHHSTEITRAIQRSVSPRRETGSRSLLAEIIKHRATEIAERLMHLNSVPCVSLWLVPAQCSFSGSEKAGLPIWLGQVSSREGSGFAKMAFRSQEGGVFFSILNTLCKKWLWLCVLGVEPLAYALRLSSAAVEIRQMAGFPAGLHGAFQIQEISHRYS